MRVIRTSLISILALGLLAGSAVGVTAQDGPEEAVVDSAPATDCVVTEGTEVPSEECVEAEPVVLPVADYWVEWANHKEASHERANRSIQDAKRSVSKTARWYQTLVGVHKDELQWLANHEPMPCYQGEYERWRGAVEDLHSIHARALRFVRANNVRGVRRTDKQRRGAMKQLNKALTNIAGCVPSESDTADARPSGNPLVGTWKTVQRFVSEDGVNVTHDTTTKFTRDGRFLARIKRDDFCRKSGLGFLPLTVEGRGEFVTDGSLRFNFDGAKVYCYPRRGGRKFILQGGSNDATPWRYDEAYDVLTGVQGGGNCSWRAKTGSPKDCTAFWRGTPAPVSRFLPREVAGEQLVVGNLSPQEVMDRFGGGGGEALRDLLLPYGKVPSDVLVAFGRNDRSILMYGMRVEGIASDELAGVVIEAQKGQLPPTVSLTTETIGERAVTVVRDTDGSEVFGAIFYPTDEVLFLITVPDEMLASVAMEDVLAELP